MKTIMTFAFPAFLALGLWACEKTTVSPDTVVAQGPDLSVAGSAAEKPDPPNAMPRAKGIVTGTNPPENKGTIKTKNSAEETYQYNVDAGHTVDGYRPKAGDEVEFTPGPGRVAHRITKAFDEKACAENCLKQLKQRILECESNFDPEGCGRDDVCRKEVEELRKRCIEEAWAEYDRCVRHCRKG